MSSSENAQPISFDAVKTRLAEIADTVDDDSLSLDEALALYEEAVVLGLQASDLLETGIVVPDEEAAAGEAASVASADASDGAGASASADAGAGAGAGAGAESTESATEQA